MPALAVRGATVWWRPDDYRAFPVHTDGYVLAATTSHVVMQDSDDQYNPDPDGEVLVIPRFRVDRIHYRCLHELANPDWPLPEGFECDCED
jgi:hypothetical protein